jgi:hypothetical protein
MEIIQIERDDDLTYLIECNVDEVRALRLAIQRYNSEDEAYDFADNGWYNGIDEVGTTVNIRIWRVINKFGN